MPRVQKHLCILLIVVDLIVNLLILDFKLGSQASVHVILLGLLKSLVLLKLPIYSISNTANFYNQYLSTGQYASVLTLNVQEI